MEGLAPSHQFLLNVRLAVENGASLRTAVRSEMQKASGEFYREVQSWYLAEERGQTFPTLSKNVYRQSLFHVLKQGLQGHPIHQALLDLETEWEEATRDDVERHLQRLPVLMLLPLLFFQFPAFLLLLLGPILLELISRFSI